MFLGSIAQEDVIFSTETIITVTPGQNFRDLMIFVEQDRYLITEGSAKLTAAYNKGETTVAAGQALVTDTSALDQQVRTAITTMAGASIAGVSASISAVDGAVVRLSNASAESSSAAAATADNDLIDAAAILNDSVSLVATRRVSLDSTVSALLAILQAVGNVFDPNNQGLDEYTDAKDLTQSVDEIISQYVSGTSDRRPEGLASIATIETLIASVINSYSTVASNASGTPFQTSANAASTAVGTWRTAAATWVAKAKALLNTDPAPVPADTVYTEWASAVTGLAAPRDAANLATSALNAEINASYATQEQAFAQSYLQFSTSVSQASTDAIAFLEAVKNVRAAKGGFIPFEENGEFSYAKVNINNFNLITKGLLYTWLKDYFMSGHSYDVWLVAVGPDIGSIPGSTIDTFLTRLKTVYSFAKVYAYWKTILVGAAFEPSAAVELAELCSLDKALLSSVPLLPCITPQEPQNDPVVAALLQKQSDAYVVAHPDVTRNGALLNLGDAQAFLNASGTAIGNNLDYHGFNYITASGDNGFNLPYGTRESLKSQKISFYKSVDSISGNVAAIGAVSLKNTYLQAQAIVAYVNYMTKEQVAAFITRRNTLRSEQTYKSILRILEANLQKFGPRGSGRLTDLAITAPGFASLPASKGDEIIVPGAWMATYVDQVHRVQVQGTLYITA
jgi:hypothetical protein